MGTSELVKAPRWVRGSNKWHLVAKEPKHSSDIYITRCGRRFPATAKWFGKPLLPSGPCLNCDRRII